jgi:hypothetical protein
VSNTRLQFALHSSSSEQRISSSFRWTSFHSEQSRDARSLTKPSTNNCEANLNHRLRNGLVCLVASWDCGFCSHTISVFEEFSVNVARSKCRSSSMSKKKKRDVNRWECD